MKSLSDVVSSAGLAGYAEVALLLFVFAFVVVLAYVLGPWGRATWAHARQLPLDDAPQPAPRQREE